MKPIRATGAEVRSQARTERRLLGLRPLEEQFAELVETIWVCENQWRIDDHIDAAIKYERRK